MRDWNDYKNHINAVDPEIAKDIKEAEEFAAIISAIIERRNSLGDRDIKMKPKSKTPFEALMITFNRVMIKAPKGAHSFSLPFLLSFLREKE